MLNNIMQNLVLLSQSRWYWLAYIGLGLFLLLDALFFQHYLGELPCVLCIQVRLWVTAMILVALLGLFSLKHKVINALAHLFMLLIAAGLAERSYQLLGTERGFVFGDCGFNLGLPAWFAVEKWLPWLYQVETSCGYTPEIIFGITMAESLMLLSVSLVLINLIMIVLYIQGIYQKNKLTC